MKRSLFFSAIREVDLPNINPVAEAYQQALKDCIDQAKREINELSDDWIVSYNGENDV